MGRIQSELYKALLAVGVPEKLAESAAESMFTENLATSQDLNQAVKELGGRTDQAVKELGDRTDQAVKELAGRTDQAVKELGDRIDKGDQKLEEKIDKIDQKLGDRIDKVDQKLGEKIDKVDQKLGDRIDQVVARIIAVEQGLAVHSWMLTSLCGMMITLLIKSFWPS